jgi:hypothetical protein
MKKETRKIVEEKLASDPENSEKQNPEHSEKQKQNQSRIANKVLMVKPRDFGFNEQTAETNNFQHHLEDESDVQNQAMAEYEAAVKKLRAAGVTVLELESPEGVVVPDALFPNNWVTIHNNQGGKRIVVTYPMLAENRRQERQLENLMDLFEKNTYLVDYVVDLSFYEEEDPPQILEGTGALVLDRHNKIAYCSLSSRANRDIFAVFANQLGYTPVSFETEIEVKVEDNNSGSSDSGGLLSKFISIFKNFNNKENDNKEIKTKKIPIYHTNMMIAVGDDYVVYFKNGVKSKEDRERLEKSFKATKKDIIEIDREQMDNMCANILQLESGNGKKLIIMSRKAYNNYTDLQLKTLEKHGEIIITEIDTIEEVGGGSIRCMMAEIF